MEGIHQESEAAGVGRLLYRRVTSVNAKWTIDVAFSCNPKSPALYGGVLITFAIEKINGENSFATNF